MYFGLLRHIARDICVWEPRWQIGAARDKPESAPTHFLATEETDHENHIILLAKDIIHFVQTFITFAMAKMAQDCIWTNFSLVV